MLITTKLATPFIPALSLSPPSNAAVLNSPSMNSPNSLHSPDEALEASTSNASNRATPLSGTSFLPTPSLPVFPWPSKQNFSSTSQYPPWTITNASLHFADGNAIPNKPSGSSCREGCSTLPRIEGHPQTWNIWKFGGTSIGSAKQIQKVASLIVDEAQFSAKMGIVVSAMSGVTSTLQSCYNKAAEMYLYNRQSNSNGTMTGMGKLWPSTVEKEMSPRFEELRYQPNLDFLYKRHSDTADELYKQNAIPEGYKKLFLRVLNSDIENIADVLRAVALSGKSSSTLSDFILCHGELWSTALLCGCVKHLFTSKKFLDSAAHPTHRPIGNNYAEESSANGYSAVELPLSLSCEPLAPQLSASKDSNSIEQAAPIFTCAPVADSSSSSTSEEVPPFDPSAADAANLPLKYSSFSTMGRLSEQSDKSTPKPSTFKCSSVSPIIEFVDAREILIVHDPSDVESSYWVSHSSRGQVYLDWRASISSLRSYLSTHVYSSFEKPRDDAPQPLHSTSFKQFPRFNTPQFPTMDSNSAYDISNKQITGVENALTLPLTENAAENDSNLRTSSKEILEKPIILLITGFICSYPNGTTTNFKRNGSDYSASLIAALLKAKELSIWSDVDGVYSADPRVVSNAVCLPFITYGEAMELAYFGARILHPFSIHPCIHDRIPIRLRNSFHPESFGTLIRESYESVDHLHSYSMPFPNPSTRILRMRAGCKAFSKITNIAVINVEGTVMLGVPGIAQRLFSALNSANCSVVLISQGSSEHSICVAVKSSELRRSIIAIENAFQVEIRIDGLMNVTYETDCSILCAVGDGMCGYVGILATLATALCSAHINVKVVVQGSSEHNISFVIKREQEMEGLRALHDAVYSEMSSSLVPPSNFCTQTNYTLHNSPANESMFPMENVKRSTALVVGTKIIVFVTELYSHVFMRAVREMKKIMKIFCSLNTTSSSTLFIYGYTDGMRLIRRCKGEDHSEEKLIESLNESAEETFNEIDNMILFDLRGILGHYFPVSSQNVLFAQTKFLKKWKNSDRLFMDPRKISYGKTLQDLHSALRQVIPAKHRTERKRLHSVKTHRKHVFSWQTASPRYANVKNVIANRFLKD
ncbi:aspartokinase [Cardiosporidium cionae]|uniref:aspartate kinase n=1 Tax=Cardiosporidium cionae TaxID=476202 RepID=A0ABQ7J9D5_9APIC|nr:aspartokinase [Cardiosporidium cionae]|eukprot:KAF8820587.1 aspartokinase [Cardiosporidium cionae]